MQSACQASTPQVKQSSQGKSIAFVMSFPMPKKGAGFPPKPKGLGLQPED